jgi:peptide/nickel transport system substrate-binding protein
MISSYVPQGQIVLVRNPNFHQWSPNIPGGHLDEIKVTIGVNADQAVNEIADGQLDWYFEAVAPDRLAELKARYRSQLHTFNPEEVWFFTLNTRKPPFNNLMVRQAVNYATNRTALVKIFGGQGAASESIVPKGIGGYVGTDFYPYNLAKAKRLVAQSHTKGMAVTVWGADFDPIPQAVQYMASVLDSLGYKASVKTLSASVYYDTMGSEKTDPQISWNNWGEDFPDAEDFIDTQLNGENITSVGNNNESNLNVPSLNHAIDAARLMPVGPRRTAAWARLNTEISTKQAPMVVYMDSVLPKFVSPKLRGLVFNGTYYELLPSMWLAK